MSTPDRILDAAAAEFAARGLDGTRMEHVARRAGVNKALVYRHFGDKGGLFTATLARELSRRQRLLDHLPDDLGQMLTFWARQQQADADFVRLTAREGLQDAGGEPVEAEARSAYYARQADMLRTLQARGDLDSNLDADALFFALLLLTVGPVLLPQIFRLVLRGAERADRWERFLLDLTASLRAPGEPGPSRR